ncbi:hypothetical protein MYU51_019703 [Penicillium brevicompactum]
MALYAARGPDHPPTSVAEQERIRELSKYYCTFSHHESSGEAAPTGDEQPGAAYLSPDITLNALAQLGVYRFGCNRSFISVIDGQSQHIIAETTTSISLRHRDQHLPDDGIYLGFRTLDLSWGVCPHTIKLFTAQDASLELDTPNITASRTRYIIRNFADEECFKDRPYVVGWPHMRFYAEVPLFSPSGHVLGSYCVVDDTPRSAFGDAEVALLQELADATAQYLESARIVHFHRRAEKLVTGVTDLVTHHSDPDAELKESHPFAGPSGQSDSDSNYLPAVASLTTTKYQESTHVTDEFLSLSLDREKSSQTEPTTVSLQDGAESIDETEPDGAHAKRAMETSSSLSISQSIASIFSRASVILRDSMDLDGVLFVDAFQSNSGTQSLVSPNAWEPSPKQLHSSFLDRLTSIQSGFKRDETPAQEARTPCENYGQAFTTSWKAENGPQILLTEQLLRKMIEAFPHGQIFMLGDRAVGSHYLSYLGGMEDSTTEINTLRDISCGLAKQLPGADSVLFFPLWDWNKSRWLAGTLLWTSKLQRALGIEELGFFKAFSNSIVSEVARVDWENTEKSKSNFISSISHELRSPLHGILGNTELLRATTLEPGQTDMVKMIESCGFTLLDVMNHLLDFTKINNLTTTAHQGGDNLELDMTGLATAFDLGDLLEQVAEIMSTSQMRRGKKYSDSEAKGPLRISTENPKSDDTQTLSVVVRVEELDAWNVRSVAGAWRRIVMSLLGNSLKWTDHGLIEVALSSIKTGGSELALAHLSVTDTGGGISPDYLRHSVFSPFSQEDPLSGGVGLGLSLVRKLVASLGGHIDIKSELDVGTQVDVYIPIHFCDEGVSEVDRYDELPDSRPATRACLVGFNDCPDLNETPTGILSTETKRKLSIQSSLSNLFLAQPNWSVSLTENLDEANGDVVIIEDTKLQQLMQADSLSVTQSRIKLFIVLGERPPVTDHVKAEIVHVSHPYGPRKLANAIDSALKRTGYSATPPEIETAFQVLNTHEDALPDPETLKPHEHTPVCAPGVPVPATLPPSTGNDTRNHVLIVDDNSINLKIMSTFMRKLGCSYETASNGLIALNKYKESDKLFTHVLMDLSMPVMDGLHSTNNIRLFEKEKGMSASCIMAVTGVASDEMQKQAKMMGLDNYLIKPVSLQGLKKVMNIV